MEERNMQLDDDGKIKMRKNREDFLDHPEKEDDEEIVIDVPDFAGFREEDDNVGLSGDELSAKNQLYEQYVAEKKAQAEKIFEQAEALFAAGELESAGEKYLDSVAVHGGDWKAWFGVVRVQTKDMTDFSGIYDCQNAYNRALKRAGKAGKEELAATYDARLKQKIAENAEEAETLEEADAAYRASKRDGLSAALEASKKPFYLSLVCFAVALVAGIVLTCLINTVSGVQILIPAMILDAAAAVALVVSLVFFRNFHFARLAYKKNESSLSTEEGRAAAELRSENELIQSIIDDFHA